MECSVDISGNMNMANCGTINYNGMTRDELISMIEERFVYLQQKEEDIRAIFEENRILTNEIIKQNTELRIYNVAYRRQVVRIAKLMNKIEKLTNRILDITNSKNGI